MSTHAHEINKYFDHKTGMALLRTTGKITWKARLRTREHGLPFQGVYSVTGYAELRVEGGNMVGLFFKRGYNSCFPFQYAKMNQVFVGCIFYSVDGFSPPH
jgi:hypothetical protein